MIAGAVAASRVPGRVNAIASLVGEVQAAYKAGFHLSQSTAEAYDTLSGRLYGDGGDVSAVLVPLRDAWERAQKAQALREADFFGALTGLLQQLERGCRPVTGGVSMRLHTMQSQAWMERDAWQALRSACDGSQDLAAFCEAYAMRRAAEAEADERVADALRRLLLELGHSGVLTNPVHPSDTANAAPVLAQELRI